MITNHSFEYNTEIHAYTHKILIAYHTYTPTRTRCNENVSTCLFFNQTHTKTEKKLENKVKLKHKTKLLRPPLHDH